MDCNTFVLLYKALVRPHVEHANSVLSPYKKSNEYCPLIRKVTEIEEIQKRATKLVISL